MTNSIREIRDADCIIITGSNTGESHPVISYEVVRAAKRGANVILIDPRRISMAEHATLFLQPPPGTDTYIFLAMAHVIVREGWADTDFIAAHTEGYEAFEKAVEQYTPEVAALRTGVPAEKIEQAARMYALGERARGESAYDDERGHSSILYAMGITQRSNGTDLVMSLANLAMVSGQVGRPSTGVNPLRGQANVQGACDVGGLPNVLPGYQRVTDDDAREAVAERWNVDALPAENGLTIVEMMHAAADGDVRAMYIMGENPMLSDPNITHVEEGLRTLDFLVVQDIFLSETAHLAHVVLPAAVSYEKDGTFTNTERRVQLLAPVVDAPGESKPDWEITGLLAQAYDAKMGHERALGYWRYPNSAAIMDEMATVTPIYGGIHHHRLHDGGLCWPCTDDEHPGTTYLHKDGNFARGRGAFQAVTARDPAEEPDEEYPLTLTTGRILYHYHTGTMTRRSDPLSWRESRGYAEVNATDAEEAGIRDGGTMLIESRRGEIKVKARYSERVPTGVVFLSFHWKESPANMLTQDHTLDPQAKIPEYKVSAVRIADPRSKRKATKKQTVTT